MKLQKLSQGTLFKEYKGSELVSLSVNEIYDQILKNQFKEKFWSTSSTSENL